MQSWRYDIRRMGSLSVAQEEELIIGLSNSEKLRLPARLSQAAPTLEDRKQYLQALLSHDPGVFLERHGKTLNAKQRQYFEPLRKGSYEVDFYLKLLEDEEKANMAKVQDAQQEDQLTSTAKNRRLAKMTRLAKEGFFEEEAARKRAPLLHHQYIGQHQSSTQAKPRADTLHDQIIQQHEEQQLQATMAAQQRDEDAAGAAFEATLSESESESGSESDSEKELGVETMEKYGPQGGHSPAGKLPSEELRQNHEEFRALMEARFLNGEDGGRDADGDDSLDDDWTKERTQDIEDKYFET